MEAFLVILYLWFAISGLIKFPIWMHLLFGLNVLMWVIANYGAFREGVEVISRDIQKLF